MSKMTRALLELVVVVGDDHSRIFSRVREWGEECVRCSTLALINAAGKGFLVELVMLRLLPQPTQKKVFEALGVAF